MKTNYFQIKHKLGELRALDILIALKNYYSLDEFEVKEIDIGNLTVRKDIISYDKTKKE